MTEWYTDGRPGEKGYEINNGFGTSQTGTLPGQKVACLVFTYEGFPDGGRALMGAVSLKGVIIADEGEKYIVKMAYCHPSDEPTKFAKHHIRPLTEEEYQSTASVVTLRH